jgi:hypothetical protein
VAAIDPLFLHTATPFTGASPFGELLTFEVHVPGKPDKTSLIKVRFAELPVAKWHDLPAEDKRRHRIVDGAGLSILRAGREVDYGWWFFGAKRRENYDSWWRGELSFEPELDELFAITHSKQGINPTPEIREVLTPDLEAAARQLNGRVQAAFAEVKQSEVRETKPAPAHPQRNGTTRHNEPHATSNGTHAPVLLVQTVRPSEDEQQYCVVVDRVKGGGFFEVRMGKGRAQLVLNKTHVFYRAVYQPLSGEARRHLDLLMLAHAKAHATCGGVGLSLAWAEELAKLLGGEA